MSSLRDRRTQAPHENEGNAIAAFDLALVEAAKQGDLVAMEALLRAARPHVRRYADHRCLVHAEDATQETLWTISRKLRSLRSAAAFPAWLLRIVARICLGFVGPVWTRIEELKEQDAAVAAQALSIEQRIDLANAIEELPEIYRLPILFHYYRDLSIANVASELAASEVTVKVRLHRGRELLRKQLALARSEAEP